MNARFLEIEITGNCIYKCRHCYGDFPKKGALSLETVRNVIDEAKGLFDCLIFSGGEPFLHPELPAMVREAAKDFLVFITTSGYPVTDEVLQAIKHKSILVFGLDGIGDTHDSYRGYPGAYNNLLQTLDRTRDMPKEIIVTLWKGVLSQIDAIIKVCAQHNAIVHFNGLIPVGRVIKSPDILPDVHELEKVHKKLYQLKMQGGSVVTDLHKIIEKDKQEGIDLFCRGRFNITPLGDVRPCEFHTAVLGNIYNESLKEIILRSHQCFLMRQREQGFKDHIRLDLENPFDYHTSICHTLPCNR
ncbi:MAG: radical SAM protein [Proteobacteria bacterium]|nr:radical SAM protein [Pseudomonadota bacterium]